MTHDPYSLLAQRLDKIPNGFPSTPSGAEIRLLQKMFSPEEAGLAVAMRITPESISAIADRTGEDAKLIQARLKDMYRKGLIRMARSGRELQFALLPFAVGFYEEQLPRMDAEMADLFEQYFQELRGTAIATVQRVIPVQEAVSCEIQVYPHESAAELIESAQAWGVRDCICRTQQKLIGKGCDRPIGNCVCFAPVAGVFDHGTVTRAVTKEEALRILKEAEMEGLVHTVANHRDGHYYICNCCSCCCGILRSVTEFEAPAAAIRSGFRMTVTDEKCAGCEDCLGRCPTKALSMRDGICAVDTLRCFGCGLCALACQTDALRLVRLPLEEQTPLAENLDEWMRQRAAERGLALGDVL